MSYRSLCELQKFFEKESGEGLSVFSHKHFIWTRDFKKKKDNILALVGTKPTSWCMNILSFHIRMCQAAMLVVVYTFEVVMVQSLRNVICIQNQK